MHKIKSIPAGLLALVQLNSGSLTEKEIIGGDDAIEHEQRVVGLAVRPDVPSTPKHSFGLAKFKTQPGKSDEVIEALKENLRQIESSEPKSISFLVLRGTDEEDTVYVWKRYSLYSPSISGIC